jgi:hypothetical protein
MNTKLWGPHGPGFGLWFCLVAVAVSATVMSGSLVPAIELGLVGLVMYWVSKDLRR